MLGDPIYRPEDFGLWLITTPGTRSLLIGVAWRLWLLSPLATRQKKRLNKDATDCVRILCIIYYTSPQTHRIPRVGCHERMLVNGFPAMWSLKTVRPGFWPGLTDTLYI